MNGQDETRYSVWFRRLGRGIALVGPTLLLLIILATFVTRLGERAEDPRGAGGSAEAPVPAGEMTQTDDAPTTAVPQVSIPEAERE